MRPTLLALEDRTAAVDVHRHQHRRHVPAAAGRHLRCGDRPGEFERRGDDTIAFDKTVFNTPQTITLTRHGQLELSDTTGTETITGPAAGVTVSGGGRAGCSRSTADVTASISGLTITGGKTAGNGGGLFN